MNDESLASLVLAAIAGLDPERALDTTFDIDLADDARVACDGSRVVEALRRLIASVARSAACAGRPWVSVRAGNSAGESVIVVEECTRVVGSDDAGSRPIARGSDAIDVVSFDRAIESMLAESARVEVMRDADVGLSVRLVFRRAG